MISKAMKAFCWAASLALLVGGTAVAWPAADSSVVHGTVVHIKVHGKSLEGNLEGDSPDRDVSVYLPPGYTSHPHERYPVLYLLHGYTDNDSNWFGAKHIFVDAPAAIDKAIQGGARPMIVVMPNAYTAYQGSMYSSSITTGDWEGFIVRDLVSYMDAHYRTIPDRISRGLAGHSMGGYGTVRLGMKYPEIFSSIYALSPCCLAPRTAAQDSAITKAEAIRSAADLGKADLGTRAMVASAAAWSPDAQNPPLYFDLPSEGPQQQLIAAEWDANAPLAMLPQYVYNLKQLRAIAMDVGTQDTLLPSVQELDRRLTALGVPHSFETYSGNHISGIQARLEQDVMPFFSKNLSFTRPKH